VDICRQKGYDVEYKRNFDGTEDKGTCIVAFPFAYPEGTMLAEEMTAIDQLEVVRRLQKEWSDNAVSCTVYYKPEELPSIREYLAKNYSKNFKTLSFLRHQGHGFDQAPYEIVSKEQYDEYSARVEPITDFNYELGIGDDECTTGVCPVR
jgi:hypothetical protein